MTNRLELTWKLDGFVDEQRYYCSETEIDPENLPVPKAVLAGDVRSHVDTSIEVGKIYYVCVGSIRGGFEKISDVVMVVAKSNTVSLLMFDTDLTDLMGKIWTPQGNLQVASGAAVFSGNKALESEINSDFSYRTGDFEWNVDIELNSIAGNQYIIDHGVGNSGTLTYFKNSLKYYNPSTGEYSPLYVTPIPLSIGVRYLVKVKRESGVTGIYVDDVLKASSNDPHNYTAQKVWIGRYPPQTGYFLNAKIYQFEINRF